MAEKIQSVVQKSLRNPSSGTTGTRRMAVALAVAAIGVGSQHAFAADYNWNPGATVLPGSGGTNNWNLSDSFWLLNPGGVSNTQWVNGSGANFAGAAGTVTINDAAVTAATLNFTTAGYMLNLGGTTQNLNTLLTNYANGTTTISNGSITMNTPTANFDSGTGTTSGSTNTLDLSGLTSFSFTGGATRTFLVRPSTSAGVTAAVTKLSLGTNFISGTNTGSQAAGDPPNAGIQIGSANGGSNGTTLTSTLQLGQTNTLNADSMILGGFNGQGAINFQNGLTNPTLNLRGIAGGTSRMGTLVVGLTNSGARLGTGTLDLSNAGGTGGSTLDARVGRLIIGLQYAAASGPTPQTSSFTMPAGTLDVTEMVIGQKANTGGPVLNATFTQGSGTVTAGTITLGRASPVNGAPLGTQAGDGAATYNSVYNLNGGTLNVGTINAIGIPGLTAVPTVSAASRRLLAFSSGTLANYDAATDLTINGIAGGVDATRPAGIVQVVASGAGVKNIDASAGRTITFGPNSTLTGTGVTVNKTGLGTLRLNQANPAFAPTGFNNPNTVTVDLNVTGGTVGGTATSTGSITTAATTTLAPGNSIGTITFGSAGLSGILGIEYSDAGGTTSDGLIDKLVVTGALTLNAGATALFSDFAPLSTLNDAAYVFASYGSLSGTFLPGTAPAGYTIDYAYNNGVNSNNIALVPVPEPTAVATIALAALPLLRRRRTMA